MKYLAIFLTIGLLGVMTWLVLDARGQATRTRNEFELFRRQYNSQPNADSGFTTERELQIAELERQLLEKQAATDAPVPPLNAPVNNTPAPAPAPVPGSLPTPGEPPSAGGLGGPITLPDFPVAGSQPVPSTIPDPTAPPPPLTPRQRQVQAAPAIGKVTDYQSEYGFVVFSGGTAVKVEAGMSFALRRGHSIVGRVTVNAVEEGSAIADIIPASVPPGVIINLGDDVIQDLP